MRIIFMGSPEFSVPALEALIEAGHEVPCVYCQPPRPAGRGKKDRPTPVHARAIALGIEVRHPSTLRTEGAQDAFAGIKSDIAVVVAYGLILPQSILDAPRFGCLNIHASLLPRWRGAAPIHRAILAGDKETGVCIMQMEAGLDTGPILLREATNIGTEETTATLHDRLSDMGAALIQKALKHRDDLDPVPQPAEGVIYAEKIRKDEAQIDWNRPAEEIDRQIRGLSPFPGAWTLYMGERVKFLGSRLAEASGAPGEVINGLTIACGAGAVEVTRAQRAGKGAMRTEDVLRGWDIHPGAQLGE